MAAVLGPLNEWPARRSLTWGQERGRSCQLWSALQLATWRRRGGTARRRCGAPSAEQHDEQRTTATSMPSSACHQVPPPAMTRAGTAAVCGFREQRAVAVRGAADGVRRGVAGEGEFADAAGPWPGVVNSCNKAG
jgi:hypothetical protein